MSDTSTRRSWLSIAVLLLVLYLPFQIALSPASGVDLASVRIAIIILFACWLIASIAKKRLVVPTTTTSLFLFSFLVLALVSYFFAANKLWSARKLIFLINFIPLYFVLASLIKEKSLSRLILIRYLVLGSFLVSLLGIAQFLMQFIFGLDTVRDFWAANMAPVFLGPAFSEAVISNPSWLVNAGGVDFFRSIATFPDPHMLAFYLGLSLPWAATQAFSSGKNLHWFYFFAILSCFILTFSRGGYVGLAIATFFSIIFFGGRFRLNKKTILAAAGVSLILVSFFAFPNAFRDRFFSIFNLAEGSNAGRLEIWGEAGKTILSRPLTGVGLGNYPLVIKPTADYREPIYAHNLYLDIAAEMGVFSMTTWLFLVGTAFVGFLALGRSNPLFLGGALSLIIFSVHSLFETPLYSVHVLPLFLITLALSDNHSDEK